MKIAVFTRKGITVELRFDTRKLCHFFRVKHPYHNHTIYTSRSIDKVFGWIDRKHSKLCQKNPEANPSNS